MEATEDVAEPMAERATAMCLHELWVLCRCSERANWSSKQLEVKMGSFGWPLDQKPRCREVQQPKLASSNYLFFEAGQGRLIQRQGKTQARP